MPKINKKTVRPTSITAADGSSFREHIADVDGDPKSNTDHALPHYVSLMSKEQERTLKPLPIPFNWSTPILTFKTYPKGTTRTGSSDESTKAKINLKILDDLMEDFNGTMRTITENAEANGAQFTSSPNHIKFDIPDETAMLLDRLRQMVLLNLVPQQLRTRSNEIIKNALYLRLSIYHMDHIRLLKFSREYIYSMVLLADPKLLNDRRLYAKASYYLQMSGFGPVSLLP